MTSLIDILPTLCRVAGCCATSRSWSWTGSPRSSSACCARSSGSTAATRACPRYDFAVCSPGAGAVTHHAAASRCSPDHDLDRLDSADLVGVPAMGAGVAGPARGGRGAAPGRRPRRLGGQRLLGHLRPRRRPGCSTAGAARPTGCTSTSWPPRCPTAIVDPDVLYVQDGRLVTSAGIGGRHRRLPAHRARRSTAPGSPTRVARRMVVPPHRDGGQRAVRRDAGAGAAAGETLAPLLAWMVEHLRRAADTVEQLAARAHMSPRTFARRFRAETGTTPYSWLTAAAAAAGRAAARGDATSRSSVVAEPGRLRHGAGAAPPLPAAPAYDAAGLPARVRGGQKPPADSAVRDGGGWDERAANGEVTRND